MAFTFESTPIPDLIIIHSQLFGDERGFFLESYKRSDFGDHGITAEFHQDNHSMSSRGVLRGLHFQRSPMDQAKLVRVVCGAVWDVAVDLRPNSETFKKWFGTELSGENGHIVYIPSGFAHGFVTLEDKTHFLYKCTVEYSPEHESGIRYDDPEIGVSWPISDVVVSDRDMKWPLLSEYEQPPFHHL